MSSNREASTCPFDVRATMCFTTANFHDTGEVSTIPEYMIAVLGYKDDLERVFRISDLWNRAYINQDAMLVKIPGRNNDPLYYIDLVDGKCAIEIGFYDTTDWPDKVDILLRDGRSFTCQVNSEHLTIRGVTNELDTRLLSWSDQDAVLVAKSELPIEFVVQQVIAGRFSEIRSEYAAGEHEIHCAVRSDSTYFGVSINTTTADHIDVEHKHIFIGRL